MSLLKSFERNIDRGPQLEVKSLKGIVSADIIREQANMARLDALEKQLDTIRVLTYRVNDLDKRLEASVKNFNSYADIAKRLQKYFVDLAIGVALDPVKMMPEREKIPIPEELKYKAGSAGKPANRGADVVQRRWTIWKAQYESGMKVLDIAKDWGCDHGSVLYAKSRNWQSTGKGWKKTGPWGKKIPSCKRVSV